MSPITLSWVITDTIFSSSMKLRYGDTPGVALAEEQLYIT